MIHNTNDMDYAYGEEDEMQVGPRTIVRGDEVIIVDGEGHSERGVVESAHNYGRNGTDDWYIELRNAKGQPVYWKQGIDGGTVEIKYIAAQR